MKLTTGLLKRIIEEEIEKLEGDYIEGTKMPSSETEADEFADTVPEAEDHYPSDPKINERAELKRIRAAKKLKLRESALENELKKVEIKDSQFVRN